MSFTTRSARKSSLLLEKTDSIMEVITILNYGAGNIRSVQNALKRLGIPSTLENNPDHIAESSKLILPGVGAFATAMSNLNKSGLHEALDYVALKKRIPVLGICLGMQLFANSSTEDGTHQGLGWIDGHVVRLSPGNGLAVPHIGFNNVVFSDNRCQLATGLTNELDFYFIHSYHFVPSHTADVLGLTNYGGNFVSAISKANIYGVQFHPEKSQGNGLLLLRNFAELALA